VKIAFLFFLLITHLCGAPASWAARHTTVCLDTQTLSTFIFVFVLVLEYTQTKLDHNFQVLN